MVDTNFTETKKTDSGRYLLGKVIENLSRGDEVGHKYVSFNKKNMTTSIFYILRF